MLVAQTTAWYELKAAPDENAKEFAEIVKGAAELKTLENGMDRDHGDLEPGGPAEVEATRRWVAAWPLAGNKDVEGAPGDKGSMVGPVDQRLGSPESLPTVRDSKNTPRLDHRRACLFLFSTTYPPDT